MSEVQPMQRTQFEDLSSRTGVFRTHLVSEFRLEENKASHAIAQDAPVLTSEEIETDPEKFKVLLRSNPNQLIKFKTFNRVINEHVFADKRLTRIQNLTSLPISVWAHQTVSNALFQEFIMLLIILNTLSLGILAEINPANFPTLVQTIDTLMLFSLHMFVLEIALKWIDSFALFWSNGWNYFDFAVTFLSSVPELVMLTNALAGNEDQSILPGLDVIARQLRVFRIFRSLKMVARFRSLRIIVLTIIRTLGSMASILLLLAIVMYMFAVMGISLFQSYTNYSSAQTAQEDLLFQNKFDGLLNAFMTLFQVLTLDQWYFIHKNMISIVSPFVGTLYFTTWVFVGAFVFRNIFVGVMVKNFGGIKEALEESQRDVKKRTDFNRLKAILKQEREERVQRETQEHLLQSFSSTQHNHIQAESALPKTPVLDGSQDVPSGFVKHQALTSNSLIGDRLRPPTAGLSTACKEHTHSPAPSVFSTSLPDTPDGEGNQAALGVVARLRRMLPSPSATKTQASIETSSLSTRPVWGPNIPVSAFTAGISEVSMWPQDSLFHYLLSLEKLQENLKEYQDLQLLANQVLADLHFTQ